ncbi:MAG: helix-turn-helix domain-containing protein [Limisphaerales bacterium]
MRNPQVLQSTLAFQREQFYREVGARIRVARESKGLTQEAVAASIGLSRTSLTNIEKGRQKLLLHTLAELASALAVPSSELLPGTVEAVPDVEIKLLSHLNEKQKEFVQRALTPVIQNEKPSDQQNPRARKPTASAVRYPERSGKR